MNFPFNFRFDLSDEGSVNKKVTWEFVKSHFNWDKDTIQSIKCPKCGLESHDLLWFEFRTSNHSWRHLAGRAGYYSKCPACEIEVYERITLMN